MVYKIEFYVYLPKVYIFFHCELRPDPDFFSSAQSDPSEKMLDTHPCFLGLVVSRIVKGNIPVQNGIIHLIGNYLIFKYWVKEVLF